jgi:hypothetical protein
MERKHILTRPFVEKSLLTYSDDYNFGCKATLSFFTSLHGIPIKECRANKISKGQTALCAHRSSGTAGFFLTVYLYESAVFDSTVATNCSVPHAADTSVPSGFRAGVHRSTFGPGVLRLLMLRVGSKRSTIRQFQFFHARVSVEQCSNFIGIWPNRCRQAEFPISVEPHLSQPSSITRIVLARIGFGSSGISPLRLH